MGRRISPYDLLAIKRETEIFNSMLKRGEIQKTNGNGTIVRTHHVVCGCGAPGCVFIRCTRVKLEEPSNG